MRDYPTLHNIRHKLK